MGLLVQKYSWLGLDREEVGEVLEAALAATHDTFAHAQVTLNQLQLRHQITVAMLDPVDAPVSLSAPAEVTPAIVPPPTRTSPSRQTPGRDLRSVNQLLADILETTLATGGFDRVLLAFVSPAHQEVCGRFVQGHAGDELMERFRFPLGVNGGRIGVAVGRGQELIIAGESALLREEQRLLKMLGVAAVAVLPLTLHRHPIGAVYVDMRRTAHLSEPVLGIARRMRDAIAIAIAREGAKKAVHRPTGAAAGAAP